MQDWQDVWLPLSYQSFTSLLYTDRGQLYDCSTLSHTIASVFLVSDSAGLWNLDRDRLITVKAKVFSKSVSSLDMGHCPPGRDRSHQDEDDYLEKLQ